MANTEDLLDQLVRLQALQLRLAMPSQADAIVELNRAGIGPTRIAELLGTTAGTVHVALQRAKSKPRPRKQKAEEDKNDVQD